MGTPEENCVIPAGPNVNTCNTTCQASQDLSDCEDNLLVTNLTSGYLHYHEMPNGVDKCIYGSQLDERTLDGHGGINKATSTYCYSPHASWHEMAAELAIQVIKIVFNLSYTVYNFFTDPIF